MQIHTNRTVRAERELVALQSGRFERSIFLDTFITFRRCSMQQIQRMRRVCRINLFKEVLSARRFGSVSGTGSAWVRADVIGQLASMGPLAVVGAAPAQGWVSAWFQQGHQ